MSTYLELLHHPVRTARSIHTHYFPQKKWRRFDALARKAGIEKLHFILSFDCDTKEDADCVLQVDACLRDMGVNPVYAVPGALIEDSPKAYTELARRGGEFINHGYTRHTFWNTRASRYESCYFYDQLPLEEVRRDIEQGDAAIRRVLGITPNGYRTPHFGCFQQPAQLQFLHGVLAGLGYDFSTSTVPRYAFSHGPLFSDFGLAELPVSGWWRDPFSIQDSWGYMASPEASLGPEGYLLHAKTTAAMFIHHGFAGILNYYADPSHIHNHPEFYEAVGFWAKAAKASTYSELLSGVTQ